MKYFILALLLTISAAQVGPYAGKETNYEKLQIYFYLEPSGLVRSRRGLILNGPLFGGNRFIKRMSMGSKGMFQNILLGKNSNC